MNRFLFATGIENSYPTIEWKGRTIRQDEMAKTKHYERWRDDFRLLSELGIDCLRYGPPTSRFMPVPPNTIGASPTKLSPPCTRRT